MTAEGPVPATSVVALNYGATRDALAGYRRRAWRVLCIGLATVALGLAVGLTVAAAVAAWAVGCGLAIAVIGAGSVRIAVRMRSALSSGPWIACPAVALPPGTGAPRLVLRAPGSGELWGLTVVAVRQRYHLVMPGASGVLWWFGDPRRRGVVAQPGGEILVWARRTRRRGQRERDIRRAVSCGLSQRAAPWQPQLPEAGLTATSTAGAPRPRRRPLFLWTALLGAVATGLGIAGSMASERDPQVDLAVVHEDAKGNCTVAWNDPWSGKRRHGPFLCDPDRDPILRDWETGFVVSYGPWKGDLYNADLEGTPAYDVNGLLGLIGVLVLAGSGVGGGMRVARRVAERRAARGASGASSPQTTADSGGCLAKDGTADAEKPADLTYAAWTELARRTAVPPSESIRRREADVRAVPWWRVRTLWKMSRLGGVLLGASGALATFLWWRFTGEADVRVFTVMVAGGVMAVISGWRAKSRGLAAVRRLVRAAQAPVPVLRPYVLVHDPHGGVPVLVLFPAHAEPDTLPDAVLAVRPPGPDKRPWLGLPDPVGTADLRGWLDDEPTVVPWIEERALWPIHGLRELRADVAGDRSYLCRLMGES